MTKRRSRFLVLVSVTMLTAGWYLPLPVVLAQADGEKPKSSSSATSSGILGEDVMYARLSQFFQLVQEGKVKDAYEALTKGSKSINDIKPLVTQTEAVIVGNGQIIDAELLRSTRVGKRLVRISYLTHGEVYPMQWNFYCYRSASGWQVLDITVNNDLYAIFDEEEKAQAEEKAKARQK